MGQSGVGAGGAGHRGKGRGNMGADWGGDALLLCAEG